MALDHSGQILWHGNSPRMNGSTTSPSDRAGAQQTSLTTAMAVAQASLWSMDLTASTAGLLASATMTCVTNGPTYAAILSPTRES
ncbi:hypothetical protein ACHAW6_000028 [Cyclotella cf. meneghiniana]